jgi:hypothetical protein
MSEEGPDRVDDLLKKRLSRPLAPFLTPESIRQALKIRDGLEVEVLDVEVDQVLEATRELALVRLGMTLCGSFSRLSEALEYLRVQLLSHPKNESLKKKMEALADIQLRAEGEQLDAFLDEEFLAYLFRERILSYENLVPLFDEIFEVAEQVQEQIVIESSEDPFTMSDYISTLRESEVKDDFVAFFVDEVQGDEGCPLVFRLMDEKTLKKYFQKFLCEQVMNWMSESQSLKISGQVLSLKDVESALVRAVEALSLKLEKTPSLAYDQYFLLQMTLWVLYRARVVLQGQLDGSDITAALMEGAEKLRKEREKDESSGAGSPLPLGDEGRGYAPPENNKWRLFDPEEGMDY